MSEKRRRLLCSNGGLFTRESVFQIGEGLEVDSSEQHEIVRRRVLFEDVRLVTYHTDRNVWYLLSTFIAGGMFVLLASMILSLGRDAWVVAAVFYGVGAIPLAMFLIRLIFGRENITVFGRRSMAVLRFSGIRGRRAREVYGQICATIRRAQASAAGPDSAP